MPAPLKLMEGENIELTITPPKLEYRTRKEVGRDYFKWIATVESLKAKYYSFVAIDAVILLCAFMTDLALLLSFALLIPLTLKAQFDYGDKLDDKQVWEGKYVTRVDCFEATPD